MHGLIVTDYKYKYKILNFILVSARVSLSGNKLCDKTSVINQNTGGILFVILLLLNNNTLFSLRKQKGHTL